MCFAQIAERCISLGGRRHPRKRTANLLQKARSRRVDRAPIQDSRGDRRGTDQPNTSRWPHPPIGPGKVTFLSATQRGVSRRCELTRIRLNCLQQRALTKGRNGPASNNSPKLERNRSNARRAISSATIEEKGAQRRVNLAQPATVSPLQLDGRLLSYSERRPSPG